MCLEDFKSPTTANKINLRNLGGSETLKLSIFLKVSTIHLFAFNLLKLIGIKIIVTLMMPPTDGVFYGKYIVSTILY